jgi:hypothetical protein
MSFISISSRDFGWDLSKLSPNELNDPKQRSFTIPDLMARASAMATVWLAFSPPRPS